MIGLDQDDARVKRKTRMNTKKIGLLTVRPHVRNGQETGKWQLDIPAKLTPNGQRRRKLFDNRKKAEEVARKLKQGLENLSLGFVPAAKRSGVTFSQVVQKWLEHEEGRVRTWKKRKKSIATDRSRIKSILNQFGKLELHHINEQKITEFQEARLACSRTQSRATVNSEVRTLMAILRWAQRMKFISEVPTVEPIPEIQKVVEIPTQDEIEVFINALVESAKPVVWFLAETGCRAGEAFNLTWDCVDEVNGWVEIKPHDGWTPKTLRSQRRIPVSATLLEMLRKMPKKGKYVFPAKDDHDKPRDNVRKAMAGASKRANLIRNGKPLKITPHILRKAYATRQAMEGTPQRVLQALLGHSPGTRVTDQHYVQATEEAKRATVNITRLQPDQSQAV